MTTIADILKESGTIKFGDFTLASGKKSKYYIDIKRASTNPGAYPLLSRCLLKPVSL